MRAGRKFCKQPNLGQGCFPGLAGSILGPREAGKNKQLPQAQEIYNYFRGALRDFTTATALNFIKSEKFTNNQRKFPARSLPGS